jgi:hypothetical protein
MTAPSPIDLDEMSERLCLDEAPIQRLSADAKSAAW